MANKKQKPRDASSKCNHALNVTRLNKYIDDCTAESSWNIAVVVDAMVGHQYAFVDGTPKPYRYTPLGSSTTTLYRGKWPQLVADMSTFVSRQFERRSKELQRKDPGSELAANLHAISVKLKNATFRARVIRDFQTMRTVASVTEKKM